MHLVGQQHIESKTGKKTIFGIIEREWNLMWCHEGSFIISTQLNWIFYSSWNAQINDKKKTFIAYEVVINILNERILHKIKLIANELVVMKRKADCY